MGVLLDTELIPSSQRMAVISEAIVYASVPCDVLHDDNRAAWARMTYAQFGQGVNTYSHAGSGIRLVRRAGHLRAGPRECLALAIHGSAAGGLVLDDEKRWLTGQELLLLDLTRPYEYFWTGDGGADSFQVDYDVLGLPVEQVRAAAGQLATSPLYGMVRAHIAQLCRDADVLSGAPAAVLPVAEASIQLVRALVCTVADDGRLRGELMAELLPDRILHWLRGHLFEPDLSLARIAAAQGISVATLNRVWAGLELAMDLPEWIRFERQATRRPDLRRPESGDLG